MSDCVPFVIFNLFACYLSVLAAMQFKKREDNTLMFYQPVSICQTIIFC